MSSSSKAKLGLELPTDPRWVNLAAISIADILTDHAYCEQKAATACISLIQLHPDRDLLVDEVSPIVTEEWGHFRQVVRELRKRGYPLGPQRKDLYVGAIMQYQRKGGSPTDRLIEKLLTCALIEARSCERFRLLSLHISDDYLKDFYHQFMVSEAGHYKLFLKLAKHYGDETKVASRWQEYLDFEADVLRSMAPDGSRMH